VRCFHAYDAPGDDWYRIVNERIERAMGERRPEPVAVPPLAPFEPNDAKLAASVATPTGAATSSRSATTSPDTAKRSWRMPLALLAAAAVGVLLALVPLSRRLQATRDLRALATEVEAYRRNTGRYPKSLDELGWRLPPLLRGGALVDPWGRPWQYRTPGPVQLSYMRPYELRSLGPDGVRSRDDFAF
jgi:general secretion pathway protein G